MSAFRSFWPSTMVSWFCCFSQLLQALFETSSPTRSCTNLGKFLEFSKSAWNSCEKQENHETIVEGRKLRKADIMESNPPPPLPPPHTHHTPQIHTTTHNNTHHTQPQTVTHTTPTHCTNPTCTGGEGEKGTQRQGDKGTGGQTEDWTANDMALDKKVRWQTLTHKKNEKKKKTMHALGMDADQGQ